MRDMTVGARSETVRRWVRVGGTRALLLGAALALLGSNGCSAPAVETVGSAQEAASANQKIAYDFFILQGFTNFQASGIVGNLIQESGAALDPTIHQGGGGVGRGIAQWSTGGRWDTGDKDNLTKFATTKGESPTSLNLQLEFIMFELMNFPEYGYTELKAATNVSDASIAFEDNFEGCVAAQFPVCAQEQRITYSKQVLATYGNDVVMGAGGAGAGGAGGQGAGGKAGAAGSSAGGTSGGTSAGASSAGAASAGSPGASGSPGAAGADASAGAPMATAGATASPGGAPGAAGVTASGAGSNSDSPSSCSFTTPHAQNPKSSDPLAFSGVILGLGLAMRAGRRRRRSSRSEF